jgi:hypothetical protein
MHHVGPKGLRVPWKRIWVMAYGDFDLRQVRKEFGLQIDEQPDLFAGVPPVQPSVTLANTLAETARLAIAINTEKARSELLITPVLLEIWRQAQSHISLFSGIEFNVDAERGLTGYVTTSSVAPKSN